MSINQKFAFKIKKIRQELNITQDELAILSNLNKSYIGKVERSEINITLQILEKLSIGLNKTPSELLDFSDIT